MFVKVESDLHLNFRKDYKPNLKGVDVYILCGDIYEGLDSLEFCSNLLLEYPELNIIEVAGNHLYYSKRHSNLTKLNETLKEMSRNIDRYYFLENNSVSINGIRFIGACLWTDFDKMNPLEVYKIQNAINDYKYIRDLDSYSRLSPYRVNYLHQNSKKYIFDTLDSVQEDCVVVTHHRPFLSFGRSNLKFAYEVDLEDMFNKCKNLPLAWFSGHSHQCFKDTREYSHGKVFFMENSLGYPHEDTGFDNKLILQI